MSTAAAKNPKTAPRPKQQDGAARGHADRVVANVVEAVGAQAASDAFAARRDRAAEETEQLLASGPAIFGDVPGASATWVRSLEGLIVTRRRNEARLAGAEAASRGQDPTPVDLAAIKADAAAELIAVVLDSRREKGFLSAVEAGLKLIESASSELEAVRHEIRGVTRAMANVEYNGGPSASTLERQADEFIAREDELAADLSRWRGALERLRPALAGRLSRIVEDAGGSAAFAQAADPTPPSDAERDPTLAELKRLRLEIEGEMHKLGRAAEIPPEDMKLVAAAAYRDIDARIKARRVELAPAAGLVEEAVTGDTTAWVKVTSLLVGDWSRPMSPYMRPWLLAGTGAMVESGPREFVDFLTGATP